MSWFFASDGQNTGASALAPVLPLNIQDWFPLGWTGWISLQSKGLSRVFSNTTVQKHQFFSTQPSLWSKSHSYMTTGKIIALTVWTLVDKVVSPCFNTICRFVISFPSHTLFHFIFAIFLWDWDDELHLETCKLRPWLSKSLQVIPALALRLELWTWGGPSKSKA